MSLADLPTELVLVIAGFIGSLHDNSQAFATSDGLCRLDDRLELKEVRLGASQDLLNFSLCNRRFYDILIDQVYIANIKYSNSSGLQWAAFKGKLAIVRKFLALGVDQNTQNNRWVCPPSWERQGLSCWGLRLSRMMLAATKGHTVVVETLLAAGVDTNQVDENTQTALIIAAERGHERLVEMLLSHDRLDAGFANADEDALFAACRKGYPNIVRLLLGCSKKGVNVDALSRGRTHRALTVAIAENHESIVHLLLDVGATVNFLPGELMSPPFNAVCYRNIGIMRILIDHGANFEREPYPAYLFHATASWGSVEAAQMIWDLGVDVNAQDEAGRTAIHVAAPREREQMIEFLLHKGADINLQGGLYGNALCAAVMEGHVGIVEMLLDRGADINSPGVNGCSSVLQTALRKHYSEVVELLRRRGAKRHTVVKYLWASMMWNRYLGQWA